MEALFWIDIAIAVALESIGLYLTAPLIWPKWKIPGKAIAYLGVSVFLAWHWPVWALLFIVGHPLLGLTGHIWFCHSRGFTWWKIDDPEQYIQAQKEWVSGLSKPSEDS